MGAKEFFGSLLDISRIGVRERQTARLQWRAELLFCSLGLLPGLLFLLPVGGVDIKNARLLAHYQPGTGDHRLDRLQPGNLLQAQ